MLFDLFGRRNCCGCAYPEPRAELPDPLPAFDRCPVPCRRCADMPPRTIGLSSGTGSAVQLTANAGAPTDFVIVGSGGAVTKYAPPAPLVTLTPDEQSAAFVLPEPSVVRCFSVAFTLSAQPTSSSAALYAALLAAPLDSDEYGLVPGSTMMLAPALTPALPAGTTLAASVPLCARVPAKLAAVLFAADPSPATVTGHVSGSIYICTP